ncbi:hypothetical protein KILIM_040_00020 [Kineosphaera limosa NBRC 100340]|uniref:Uncharacterized protein n=1 Tax=Kineosphaera limosa NBRC 100340 TaxID=1184609 RepID=K6WWL1_9MICO|nr:hypothetical protein KILIM_040_00020 [Kineosphaera limosa NBRC 100340]
MWSLPTVAVATASLGRERNGEPGGCGLTCWAVRVLPTVAVATATVGRVRDGRAGRGDGSPPRLAAAASAA